MNTKTIKVVSYLRCSDERQDRSIGQQTDEVEKWADRFTTQTGEKVRLVRKYVDEGVSGDKAEKRPGFQRLLADAKSGDFEGIVCFDLNRLGRFDPMEFGFYLLPVRRAGVRLFTLDRGERDWHDAIGQVLNAIETTGNKEFLSKLSKGVLRGRRETTQNGRWAGGPIPYGYKVIPDEAAPQRRDGTRPKMLVIHSPERAALVKEIFERYGRGEVSMLALAKEFNARRLPPPSAELRKRPAKNGKPRGWGRWSITGILTSPVYLGKLVWNRRARSKYHEIVGGTISPKHCPTETPKLEHHPKEDWVVKEGTHEALIDQATWDLVQQKIAARKGTNRKGGTVGEGMNTHGTRATLFAGLVFCGSCGSKMHGYRQSDSKRERRYACEGIRSGSKGGCRAFRTIAETDLVQAASAFVLRYIGKESVAEWTAEAERRLLAAAKVDPSALVKVRAEVAALDVKIDAGEDAYLSAPASIRGGLAAKLEKWKAERDGKRERIKELEASAVQVSDVKATARAVATAMAGLRDALTDGDDEKRRAVFRLVCERIDVMFEDRYYRRRVCSKPGGCLVHVREETFMVGSLVGPVLALLDLDKQVTSCPSCRADRRGAFA